MIEKRLQYKLKKMDLVYNQENCNLNLCQWAHILYIYLLTGKMSKSILAKTYRDVSAYHEVIPPDCIDDDALFERLNINSKRIDSKFADYIISCCEKFDCSLELAGFLFYLIYKTSKLHDNGKEDDDDEDFDNYGIQYNSLSVSEDLNFYEHHIKRSDPILIFMIEEYKKIMSDNCIYMESPSYILCKDGHSALVIGKGSSVEIKWCEDDDFGTEYIK